MQTLLVKIDSKWRDLVYTCFDEKKTTFLNLLRILSLKIHKDVYRIYLKNYDSCLINCSVKSNSPFWYYVKQKLNVFIRAMVRKFHSVIFSLGYVDSIFHSWKYSYHCTHKHSIFVYKYVQIPAYIKKLLEYSDLSIVLWPRERSFLLRAFCFTSFCTRSL